MKLPLRINLKALLATTVFSLFIQCPSVHAQHANPLAEVYEYHLKIQKDEAKLKDVALLKSQLEVQSPQMEEYLHSKLGVGSGDLDETTKSHLQEWGKINSLYQQHLDQLIKDQYRFVVEATYLGLDYLVSVLPSSLKKSKGQEDWEKLKKIKQDYVQAEPGYGQKGDFKRIRLFREYLNKAKAMVENLKKSSQNQNHGFFDKLLFQVGGPLGKLIVNAIWGSEGNQINSPSQLLGPAGRVMAQALSIGGKDENNSTPLTSRLVEFFHSLGKVLNYEYQIEGEEAPFQLPETNINLVVMNHSHALEDLFGIAALKPSNHMLFAALYGMLPGRVAKFIDHYHPSLIGVGPGYHPKEKTIKGLKDKVSNNILVFPQGLVGKIGEIGPIRDEFSTGLIQEILDTETDLPLNLWPVTFVHPDLFNSEKDPDHKNQNNVLTIKTHTPLSEKHLRLLMEVVGKTAPNLYMRDLWLTDHPSNLQFLHGQLRTGPLMERLEKFLKYPIFTQKKDAPLSCEEKSQLAQLRSLTFPQLQEWHSLRPLLTTLLAIRQSIKKHQK